MIAKHDGEWIDPSENRGHWVGYPIPSDKNPLGLREYEYVIPKSTTKRLGDNVLRAINDSARIWIGADNGQWLGVSKAFSNIQLTMKEEKGDEI